MFPLKRIVCPTDFSEPSLEGIRNAVELSEKFDAELIIAHVIEIPTWSANLYSSYMYSFTEVTGPIRKEVTESLTMLLADLVPAHIRSRIVIPEGKPAEEIVRLASEEGANLIVIATHGYSGFHRFVFGSVTERVVRTAPCPVLTVRPKDVT